MGFDPFVCGGLEAIRCAGAPPPLLARNHAQRSQGDQNHHGGGADDGSLFWGCPRFGSSVGVPGGWFQQALPICGGLGGFFLGLLGAMGAPILVKGFLGCVDRSPCLVALGGRYQLGELFGLRTGHVA